MPSGLAQRQRSASSRLRTVLAEGGAAIPAWPLLGALCAASTVLLVGIGTRLTFFHDEWFFLLQRPGLNAEAIFEPHNGHLSAVPVLIYKGLTELFGLETQLPFRLVLVTLVVSLAVLVFIFVRARAGQLLALIAAALLLFLGPAWEDLLWSFQMGLIGSLVTGVGALMALERGSARHNAIACLLLVASLLFSDLGVPFVIAATLAVLLRRRPAQLWIAAVPMLIFISWWIGYGSEAPSEVTFGNIARLPTYVLDAAASGLASIVGLTQAPWTNSEPSSWGRPLLAVALAGTVYWILRGGRPAPQALVIAAAALSFWALAGANFIPGREPIASRYQLISATFLILLAAELFRPVNLSPGVLAGIAALSMLALGSNIGALRNGYDFLYRDAAFTEANLGALEIVGARAPDSFQLIEAVAQTPHMFGVTSAAYLRESSEHGTPADSPAEIAVAPAEVRMAADNVMLAGYEVRLEPPSAPPGARGCRRLGVGFDGGPRELVLRPGGATVKNLGGPPLELFLRRFASPTLSVGVGRLAAGFAARIEVPDDDLALPWRLVASGGSPLEVCP